MGGMGGGKQTTSETKTVTLPPWVDKASQANYAQAQQVANRPYAAYGGQTVAGLAPEFYQAQGLLGNLDDYYKNYSDATDIYNQTGTYNPTAVKGYNASQFAGTDLAPYLNPYTAEVENRAISNAERSGRIAQRDLAAGAPARGGSREAIRAAVQGAETSRGIGDLSAQLRAQGFDKATGLATGDIAAQNEQKYRNVQTELENEKYRQSANQMRTTAAEGLTQTADQAQAARRNEIMTMLGLGQISQEQAQREMDDLAGKWQKERDYPLEQLNILMSALGMSPYGHTETGTSTTKSSGGGGMGGLLSGGMGLLQAFAGMSDRTEKTDIKQIGHDKGLDVPLYAYRYKGDPKTYPKVVGPMAQDLEKKHPQLVRKVSGKRVVDLTTLMRTA